MRISDWSSDACSSDLGSGLLSAPVLLCVVTQPASANNRHGITTRSKRMRSPLVLPLAKFGAASGAVGNLPRQLATGRVDVVAAGPSQPGQHAGIEQQIGRASCRERVCQYV